MSRPPLSLAAGPPDLTAAILARTSGPACDRLRALACDFVDAMLPTVDRELAARHLEHCPQCRDLVTALEMALRALPALARVDPGSAFTASVVLRTRSPLPPIPPPQDPLLAGWTRFLRRPRAALEAAYLATAAGLVLTQLPLPGSAGPAGSALVSLVWTEGRASIPRAAFQGQGWTRRALGSPPVWALRARESAWTFHWIHFQQRLERSWKRLAGAANAAWTWLWPRKGTSAPPPTEPPKAPVRSAL